jgi:arylsulfatase A-like enzyme
MIGIKPRQFFKTMPAQTHTLPRNIRNTRNPLILPSLSAGVLLLASTAGAAESRRPNIVFIFSDDHATSTISAYGDGRRLVDTPQLDRIAREGMRFDRCLVTNSICGPSRATVLTGLYNHLNGFVNNSNCTFDGSQTTFPKLLRSAGYQTALIGKWHLKSDPTGFDFWQILPGQGNYYNPPMIRNGEKINMEGYVTDIITDLSLDWLRQRDNARPFLLMIQHKAPHREWYPALRHLDADHDRVYAEPPTLFDDYSGRGPAVREQDMSLARTLEPADSKLAPTRKAGRLTPAQQAEWDRYYEPRNARFHAENPQGDDLIRWKYQRYMHDYTATIRGVDENIGRVLDHLEKSGLAENTIVIYSSDQGFFLGEHGWFDKRWIYEESLRTPFLVRWPGMIKPGSTSRAIVSTLDFAPTLLEVAGVPVPAEMQGRSLVPLFRGKTPADWRRAFYYEYYEYPAPHRVWPHEGVVTDQYKLVHFYAPGRESYWELFDLATDPHELASVHGKPAYQSVQKELEGDLARLKSELKVPDKIPPAWFGKQEGVLSAKGKKRNTRSED